MKNDDGLPGVVIPALPQAPMGPIRVRLQAWFQPVDLGNRVIGRSQCFHCLLGYFVPTIGSPAPAEIEQAPAKKARGRRAFPMRPATRRWQGNKA